MKSLEARLFGLSTTFLKTSQMQPFLQAIAEIGKNSKVEEEGWTALRLHRSVE